MAKEPEFRATSPSEGVNTGSAGTLQNRTDAQDSPITGSASFEAVKNSKNDELEDGLRAMATIASWLPKKAIDTYEPPGHPSGVEQLFANNPSLSSRLAAEREDFRRDSANAIEQSERSPEKKAVSEGPFPETLSDAARWLIGAVFVFVAGFEGYVMLWEGRIISGLVSVVIAIALTILVVWWRKIPWARKDVRWVFVSVIFAIEIIALSPFVEQQRLPFTSSSLPPPPTGRVWSSLTDDQKSSLGLVIGALPKHETFQVICLNSDCRLLAQDWMQVFNDAEWNPVLVSSVFFQEPYGLALYQQDVNDRRLADTLEKTTKLKVSHIFPSSLPKIDSIFIGLRP